MEPLQELIELESLRRLKAQYFYYLDTKKWEAWLSLFVPDATLQWDSAPSTRGRDAQASPKHTGVDAIRKYVVEEILDPAQTVHHGHTPILELISSTEARAIWAMEDIVDSPSQTANLQAYGHYHETYRKVDGHWKISSLHLTRLRVRITTK
jgi:hypothetical protein